MGLIIGAEVKNSINVLISNFIKFISKIIETYKY